jgi:NADH-quinone oxidoreductase subunit G
VHSRVETVLRLVARENPAVDGGWLCDRGRFDTLPVASERHAVHPLIRVAGGTTEVVTWRRAIDRALELIGPAPGVLVSPHLSNEAIWLIANRLLPQLGGAPAALWPDVGGNWPVEGAITNLLDCKRIVLVGLDVWNDLPVLALWIRKAVARGAQLVVVGDANGLFRDTASWLETGSSPGDAVETADALRAALADATAAPSEVAAAASHLSGAGDGPAALLVHPRLLREAGAEERLRALAEALGARGDAGLVGAPQLAANARGAHELAPTLAGTDPATVISAATSGQLSSLLLFGTEPWAELDTGQARLIVATTVLPDGDPRVDVVLPLAHAYESQGTITNFEGRVQHQQGGASPPGRARSDWGVAAELAIALGGTGPERLEEIRAAIAADHVAWQAALQPPAELVARV